MQNLGNDNALAGVLPPPAIDPRLVNRSRRTAWARTVTVRRDGMRRHIYIAPALAGVPHRRLTRGADGVFQRIAHLLFLGLMR